MVKLFNNDCINILRKMDAKSVDLVVIDPPYDVDTEGGGGICNTKLGLRASLDDLKQNQDISNGYDIEAVNTELVRVMKDINIYIWCNKRQIPQYFDFYLGGHSCKFDILCWHKNNAIPAFSGKYLTDTEYCLYFHKGHLSPETYYDAKTYTEEPINIKDKSLYGHPTIKPLGFIKRLIRNSSKKGEIVLDCFMGSGTTGVACVEEQRDFIGVEINKTYFDAAKERIKTAEQSPLLFYM